MYDLVLKEQNSARCLQISPKGAEFGSVYKLAPKEQNSHSVYKLVPKEQNSAQCLQINPKGAEFGTKEQNSARRLRQTGPKRSRIRHSVYKLVGKRQYSAQQAAAS